MISSFDTGSMSGRVHESELTFAGQLTNGNSAR